LLDRAQCRGKPSRELIDLLHDGVGKEIDRSAEQQGDHRDDAGQRPASGQAKPAGSERGEMGQKNGEKYSRENRQIDIDRGPEKQNSECDCRRGPDIVSPPPKHSETNTFARLNPSASQPFRAPSRADAAKWRLANPRMPRADVKHSMDRTGFVGV